MMNTPNGNIEAHRLSPSLTFDGAVDVWKGHSLGEKQHHIAQAFGVNQGRINEVLKERRHVGSRLVALGEHPFGKVCMPVH